MVPLIHKDVIKEREGHRFLNVPANITYVNNVQTGSYGGQLNKDFAPFVESIRYTTGKHRFNNCIHTREQTLYAGNPAVKATLLYQGQPHLREDYYEHHPKTMTAHITSVEQATIALDAIQPLYDYDEIGARALDIMTPTLEEISIPNFLLELKDMRTMFQFWSRDSSLLKNVAGQNLNYNFGWKPFIGDAQKLYSALTSTFQKLKDWQKLVGTEQVRHCKIKSLMGTATGSFNFQGSSQHPCSWKASQEGAISAHLKYRPQAVKAMRDVELSVRAMLQALGVKLNAGIVWNAIPFSFVVDWFFDVGRRLDRMSIDTLELPIEFVDFCAQIKRIRYIETELHLYGASSTWYGTPKTHVSSIHTYFRRNVYNPFTALAGNGWHLPTWNQAILGVSLAITNQR